MSSRDATSGHQTISEFDACVDYPKETGTPKAEQQKLAMTLLGSNNDDLWYDPNVSSTLQDLVSWKGIHVTWFQRCFMETPEVQRLVKFGCRMWFVRNVCTTLLLRAKGVHSDSMVQHLQKFAATNNDESSSMEKPSKNNATAFVSYTGAYTLEHFAELINHPSLSGHYAWIDAFCVDQFVWTERNDDEMRDFKDSFLGQLGEKIQLVEYTTLMLHEWDSLMETLRQI